MPTYVKQLFTDSGKEILGQVKWGQKINCNIVISEPKQDENGKYVEVGPKAPFFYGKFLEYGTSKMSPRPFMGPAKAESKKQVLETIRQTLKEGLGL